MAYGADTRTDGLDELTTLADTDLLVAADATDSYRLKKITKANLATDLSAVNASETVKGVVEEATDAQVLAGTATGETGAKLFVTPAKLLTNLPTMTGGNLTFSATADENLTIGTPVGVSNNKSGYVAQANRTYESETLSFTPSGEIGAFANDVCAIATDKFVFISPQAADDTLYATVGTVAPTTKELTLGISAAVTADIKDNIYAICKLDTDRFIVFYQEDASTTLVKYRIGTVSTTTITFGAAGTFATAASEYSYLTSGYLSAEKGVMTYVCATGDNSRAIAFTTAGDVASPGTPKEMGDNIEENKSQKLVKIDTDKFMIVSSNGYAQAGTCIGGTTITLGSEVQYTVDISDTEQCFYAVSPTTDTVIAIYKDNGSNWNNLTAMTVSGTTITAGSMLEVSSNLVNGSIYADSTSSVIVADSQTIIRFTLSGTTLSSQGTIITSFDSTVTMNKFVNLGTYYVTVGFSSTTFYLTIEGMANGFIGIAQSTVSKGDTVNILYRGKDTNQNNLIPGGYYLASSGAFTLVSSRVTVDTLDDCNIAKALTSSQIII